MRRGSLLSVIALLVVGLACVLLIRSIFRTPASHLQVLANGSVLTLNRVEIGSNISFAHGKLIEKLLGNFIPSNGVHLLNFDLKRRTYDAFGNSGKSWLVAEFKLTGPNARNHPLMNPLFFRQFRVVIYGENGFEFAQEWWGEKFMPYREGDYGYIATSRFPRDSRWLGFRVEKRQSNDKGGPCEVIADLKITNPVHPAIQPWLADPPGTTKSVGGLDLTLGSAVVRTFPYKSNDIWNHSVDLPVEVKSNGTLVTNWEARFTQAEDASGNWDLFASHRSLDPHYVWKLESDFEMQSGFPPGSVVTIPLPASGSATVTTNLLNLPVTVSWDGNWIDASIPSTHPELALRCVSIANDEGETARDGSASWSQYHFRKGDFMVQRNNVLFTGFKPTRVVVAVVSNFHATFYTQPKVEAKPSE